MAKKRGRNKKSLLARFCFLAFIIYACVVLVDMQVNLAERKKQLEDLEMQCKVQRLENREIERQIETGIDEEYIERKAREMLDYVDPNEKVYIDISGN